MFESVTCKNCVEMFIQMAKWSVCNVCELNPRGSVLLIFLQQLVYGHVSMSNISQFTVVSTYIGRPCRGGLHGMHTAPSRSTTG